MDEVFIFFLIIYLGLCYMVGNAATSKGRNAYTCGFIAFCISPVLAGFLVAFMRDIDTYKNQDTDKK